ncbi:hypothetical protein BC829DRAFT_444110 [Chytridium lagenaria]|nr:hypothetical protein BC829DRAFT_444110 [Chytridium lagenaria]
MRYIIVALLSFLLLAFAVTVKAHPLSSPSSTSSAQNNANLTSSSSGISILLHSSDPSELNNTTTTVVPRPVLDTGLPPAFDRATGTAIFRGQSSAIRFTSPSDVIGGSRLLRIQLVLRGGNAPSNARLSVVDDSGFNSPSKTVLETRTFRVPKYDGRITITAESNGNLILYPAKFSGLSLRATRVTSPTPSLLDSENGLGWTAFRASSLKQLSRITTPLKESNVNDEESQMNVQTSAAGLDR